MELNEKQVHILKVAEVLFAEKGFDKASVRDIAKAAEVNVAMISYYFGSKEKLLWALMQDRWDRSNRTLEDLYKNQNLAPWQKMERVIDYFVDNMLINSNFHIITNRRFSLVKKDSELGPMLVKIMKRNGGKIIDIIEEGKRKGVFAKVDDELTIGTIIGTISRASMSRLYYSDLLGIDAGDDKKFLEVMKPRLKKHLKQLLKSFLLTKPEK